MSFGLIYILGWFVIFGLIFSDPFCILLVIITLLLWRLRQSMENNLQYKKAPTKPLCCPQCGSRDYSGKKKSFGFTNQYDTRGINWLYRYQCNRCSKKWLRI